MEIYGHWELVGVVENVLVLILGIIGLLKLNETKIKKELFNKIIIIGGTFVVLGYIFYALFFPLVFGNPKKQMPDVKGYQKDYAVDMLEEEGLWVTVEYQKNSDVAEGIVLKQSIEAGTCIESGDKVTIVISSGKEIIYVANVVGKKQEEAKTVLSEQGFKVLLHEDYSFEVEKGKVISQSPGAGSPQIKDVVIELYISKGKQETVITYDANGGNVNKQSDTVYYEGEYGDLPIPEREGYKFEGWYTAREGGIEVTSTTKVTSTENHNLYAHWTQCSYRVTFNSDGGSVDPSSKTVTYNGTYGTLPIPKKDGHTFSYWKLSDGTKITENTTVNITGNVTLTAVWTLNSYTASWNSGTGYTITVKRTSSPNAGASTGTISSGAKVYYGDVLNVQYTASTGYSISKKGATSITVTGNVTSSNIYATSSVNSYTASWNTETGYTVTVKRISSPNAGASTGTISSGAKVYYGDVLNVQYTANAGHSISKKGATSITVTGDVTSSNIYASAMVNSYTYNIVYKSSNGTKLGTSTATYKYGTTNKISPKTFNGYTSPSAQSVKWDSTGAKTITFTYTPTAVSSTIKTGTISDIVASNGKYPTLTYSATIEHRNRTATSVQIRVVWTTTLKAYNWTNYGQRFVASVGSVSTDVVHLIEYKDWTDNSAASSTRSATVASDWITVPLSTTNTTTIDLGIYYYQVNSNELDMYKYNGTPAVNTTWSIAVQAY